MARLKGNCMECGKCVANAKLISPPKSDKKLCIYCRKKELHIRNKAIPAKIIMNGSKSLEKDKKVLKISKKRTNMLSKDEEVFLKTTKYKHDTFIAGTSDCSALINLKNKLNECEIKINKAKIQEQKEIQTKKEIDKNFLSGLL